MNGDPYRAPSDRRVINRAGSAAAPAASGGAYRQPDEPVPAPAPRDEPPRGTPRTSHSDDTREKKSRKGLLWTIISVIVVALIAVSGWFVWSNTLGAATGIDTSRYQAVFLSNGQIYFGKLESFNRESFKITKVYYPEAQATAEGEAATDATTQSSSIKLIPVTDGVQGAEDEMIIMKDQILYYENLKADSQVAKLIQQNAK